MGIYSILESGEQTFLPFPTEEKLADAALVHVLVWPDLVDKVYLLTVTSDGRREHITLGVAPILEERSLPQSSTEGTHPCVDEELSQAR